VLTDEQLFFACLYFFAAAGDYSSERIKRKTKKSKRSSK
jgi:hypothetical protein